MIEEWRSDRGYGAGVLKRFQDAVKQVRLVHGRGVNWWECPNQKLCEVETAANINQELLSNVQAFQGCGGLAAGGLPPGHKAQRRERE